MDYFSRISKALSPARKPASSGMTGTGAGGAGGVGTLGGGKGKGKNGVEEKLNQFHKAWTIVKATLTNPPTSTETVPALSSTPIPRSLQTMLDLVVLEASLNPPSSSRPSGLPASSASPGPILEYFLRESVPSQLVSLCLPDRPKGVKGEVIRWFGNATVMMDERFLVHARVGGALVRLLRGCVEPEGEGDGGWRTADPEYEEDLVDLMCHVCSRIKSFPELLVIFFPDKSAPPSTNTSPAIPQGSTLTDRLMDSKGSLVSESFSNPSSGASVVRRPASPAPSNASSSTNLSVSSIDQTSSATHPTSVSSSSRPGKLGTAGRPTNPTLGVASHDQDFILFPYLLRFVHREGRIGDFARAGLLFLIDTALSGGSQAVAYRLDEDTDTRTPLSGADSSNSATGSLSKKAALASAASDAILPLCLSLLTYLHESDFAEVLSAGLGALYGLLPSKLIVRRLGSRKGRKGEGGEEYYEGDEETSGGVDGMVLGGMGDLADSDEENDSSEEAVQRRAKKREEVEREENRLRALGLESSDDPGFKAQLDLWLKLVEFAQDIVRRSPALPGGEGGGVKEGGSEDPLEDGDLEEVQPIEALADAFTRSILTSIRSIFLSNVLYPSILECSDQDGSAVAVLSYLDAIFGVLAEDVGRGSSTEAKGRLAECIIGFLMGEEDETDTRELKRRRQRSGTLMMGDDLTEDGSSTFGDRDSTISTAKAKAAKLRRRKSTALILIEKSAPDHSRGASDYFTSLGRFSLKDLLTSHLNSTSQPTATAAYSVLNTLLRQHDRYAVDLLEARFEAGATNFPAAVSSLDFALDEIAAGGSAVGRGSRWGAEDLEDDTDSEVFVYPGADRDQDSDDEFIYPELKVDADSATTPRPAVGGSKHASDGRLAPTKDLVFTPSRSPGLAMSRNVDEIGQLLALASSIDKSASPFQSSISAHEIMSTGYSHYLEDAEAAIASDAGFKRGLSMPRSTKKEKRNTTRRTSTSPSQSRPRQSLPRNMSGDLALREEDDTFHHTLSAYSPVMSLILSSLAHFFSHSPDLNLALTAVLSSLASSPFRSLDGWLIPPRSGSEPEESRLAEFVSRANQSEVGKGRRRTGTVISDDGDDRSVDFEVEELAREDALESGGGGGPTRITQLAKSGGSNAQDDPFDKAAVFGIIRELVRQVDQYRATIPNFDRYLRERRQGLMFVENLADALDTDDLLSGTSFEAQGSATSSLGLGISKGNGFLSPPTSPDFNSEFGAPSTPLANKSKPPTFSSFLTPSRPSPRQTPSSSSQVSNLLDFTGASRPSRADSLAPPPNAARTGGPTSPFAAHYKQTGSITVKPLVADTPFLSRRRSLGSGITSPPSSSLMSPRSANSPVPSDDGVGPDTPTKRLSPASRFTASNISVASKDKEREEKDPNVSLSAILDNVVILEEAIKELVAIVQVRRSLGIDPVI